MAKAELYVGLISGTSVDGVDCALVDFAGDSPKVVSTHFQETPEDLRELVLRACSGDTISPATLGSLDHQIGHFFATGTQALLDQEGVSASEIIALGSHGQTVWHQPSGEHPFTLQLGDPNIIAFDTGIVTIADFRRMDMAAGGQGAPLAPLLHQAVFYSEAEDRAVVNIGGISNITCLPTSGSSLAFDTGPGNVLMDYWINKHQGHRYDSKGDWAKSGQAQSALINHLLDEPYLKAPYPKSTGRELFNGNWLESKLAQFSALSPADVQASLVEFTARSIATSILELMTPSALYVCGGGAHNKVLMAALSAHLDDCKVTSTELLSIHPDWVEAVAFAWMAKETLAGRKIDTRPFTGAARPVTLGGLYTP
ncbi:MAG: anhydro-N-acetylmuramic acid kinase [Pseudohongiellaceae bacterium]